METNKPHVVIVDDDEAYQVLFEDKLSEAGYKTTVAGSKSAAEASLESKPDLFLLDYTLPDGTGQEILELIRGQESEWAQTVPVLMFTQHDDPKKVADSVSAGAQAYMVKKDITVSEVVEKVKEQFQIDN